jgi:pimeloyl-ACP methyl ester carboxylesterase
VTTERKWLLRFGGVYRTTDSYAHELWDLLRAPEYSLYDVGRWPSGSSRSLGRLWPEVMNINFFVTISEVDVPVHFFLGRYDYTVPSQVGAQYYEQLAAPAGKHLLWFENAAHDIFFDEPDRLVAETLAILEAQP